MPKIKITEAHRFPGPVKLGVNGIIKEIPVGVAVDVHPDIAEQLTNGGVAFDVLADDAKDDGAASAGVADAASEKANPDELGASAPDTVQETPPPPGETATGSAFGTHGNGSDLNSQPAPLTSENDRPLTVPGAATPVDPAVVAPAGEAAPAPAPAPAPAKRDAPVKRTPAKTPAKKASAKAK